MQYPINLSPKIKSQILAVIFQILDPDATTVFLFGSRAEQTYTNYSDIDIGIIGRKQIDDATFLLLDERLNYEVDTLYKIDLVDFKRVDDAFRQFAMRKVELWHTVKNFKEKLPI